MPTASYEQPVIPGLEPFCLTDPISVNQGLALDGARAETLEALYQSSGRSDPAHPLHGTLTGLWEDLCLTAGRALMNHALQHPEQLQVTARPAQPPVQVDPAPGGLSLGEARAIREQAHAAAAESIRLQQGADLLRAQYFRGLAALHDGPGASSFEELGTPAWRA
jgi:hypothetical protein